MFSTRFVGRTLGLALASVVLVSFALPARPASAGGDKELDSVLKSIEWGDSKDQVLGKLKQQMMQKLRERKDLRHDRVAMQKARKRVVEKYRRIKDTYTELKGDTTNYKVSVIADEFTRNNGESLLKVDDKVAQRFYFFADGSLYKMVVAYKQSYLDGVGFESFVNRVAGKYGDPGETKYAKINDEKTMARAIWTQGGTRLRAKNQKEFFGTFSLAFSDKTRVDRMAKKDRSFGGSDKDREEVSGRVESLKEDSGRDRNADVVDNMVGESVEVDLARDKKDLEKQGPTGKTGEGGKSAKKKVADKEQSEEPDRQEQRQQQEEDDEEERDFSDIGSSKEKKKDDELIIY